MNSGFPQLLVNKLIGVFESLTGYIANISSDHAYIHKGWAFTSLINTGSISAPYDIAFTTPITEDGKYIHWRPLGITSSANYVGYTLYEGDTYTGGTAVTPINRNRNSDNVSTMQAFVTNATATPVGTILDIGGIGTTGAPQARAGGGSGADEELLLQPDTDYVLTLVPAGATICTLRLFWYEEEGYIVG